MMDRVVICLLVLAMPIVASAQQKPVFDPLNAPESAATKPRATAAPAPVETMVVTPEPERVNPPPPVATAAPKPAPVVPSGPRVVAYDELETQVGKSIAIKTNLRTTRKGTLKRFNRAGLVIEDMSRGFAMSIDIPRSTVVEVTVLN